MSHHEEELNDYIREEAESNEEEDFTTDEEDSSDNKLSRAFLYEKAKEQIEKKRLKKNDLIDKLATTTADLTLEEWKVEAMEEIIEKLRMTIDCGSPQQCFKIRKELQKENEELKEEIAKRENYLLQNGRKMERYDILYKVNTELKEENEKLKEEKEEVQGENESLKYHIDTLKEEIFQLERTGIQ